MPSEKARSKEDTWTTKELEGALKKEDRRRPTRDRDDRDRKHDKHREEVNGEEKHRRHRDEDDARGERRRRHDDADDDGGRRRKPHDDDRRSRHKDEEGRDRKRDGHRQRESEVELSEEDRERLRRERREKKEGRTSSKDDREKQSAQRDEADREPERQRRHRDEDDERRRGHRDEARDQERRRGHRGEDKDDKRSKDRPRHGKRDDEEEEREKQRRERREKKEREMRESERDKDKARVDGDDRKKKRPEEKDRQRDDRHSKSERYEEKKKPRSRDVDDGKKSSHSRTLSDKKHSKKREVVSAKSRSHKPAVEEKVEEADDYEDDFEDYEDDFEEEDDQAPKQTGDSEMDEVLRALDAENDRLITQSRSSDRSSSTEKSNEPDVDRASSPVYQPKPQRSHTVIDFVSAKQRALDQKTSSKTRQRGIDLLSMIELDVARFDLFELPPVREYDLYIRSFGRSDTRQAYVQTNEDNIDRDIQTEEIDCRQKWTQHPPEDFNGCGRGDGEKDEKDELQAFQQSKHQQQDLSRLSHFLQRAGQTISILLEEEREDGEGAGHDKKSSHLSISEGYTQLGNLAFLEGRHVQYAHFSPTQPNLVLTIYSQPAEINPADPVGDKGIICVWNTNESFYPQKILACQSQPTCCCFSPVKTSLAFAGMVDGSVAVWDLREPSSIHNHVTVQDKYHTLRFPTYNTAGVLDHENHHSSVRTITPIVSYAHSEKKESSDDLGTGLSFQLVSLEENAVLSFWVVAEIQSPDPAGSETDLGLAPGGRIKLIKSSSLALDASSRESPTSCGLRALELQLLSSDPNHYYVGTDSGTILHGLRFGARAYPICHSTEIKSLVEITCIDFSPFNHPCFLAGCGDGTVRLYHTRTENPVVTWPVCSEGAVLCVFWSRSRPCVFYVLDETSTLHVYDILEGDAVPLKAERIQNRIATMAFTTDHHAMGVGIPGKIPQMLLSLENGQTEIHTITKQLRQQQTLEQEFLESYLDRF